jgi:hypothetical protein
MVAESDGDLVGLGIIGRHRVTWIGSPRPCSDHSDFSNSLGLLPITALAACRMRVVER